ncbi:circadian clock KaiB family protein [Flavobacterium qiangtangense]|uniref:Circadian clock KaiB family protein n=1 Tax=Flavobacterium qiangtangense TaxID=1442595 RepID=A0ABW1PN90_9FLAO
MENSQNNMADSGRYNFILFISGMSTKSSRAIENLREICDEHLPDNFDLQIVDITNEEHQAVNYQIVGVPTLIKTNPNPRRTILGDLSDTEKVLRILDLA